MKIRNVIPAKAGIQIHLVLLLLCAFVLACSGCGVFSLLTLGNKKTSDLEKKVAELTEKLGAKAGEVAVTNAELEKLKEDTITFMGLKNSSKSLNFRVWAVIKAFCKFVFTGLYEMVIATWLWDFIRLMGWIVFLTWISNMLGKLLSFVPYLKLITFWMLFEGRMKIVTTVIWAFILSWIWKWTHAPADWLFYCLPVSLAACAFANFAWEYIMNKTTASTRAINTAKKLLNPKAVKLLNI